MGDFLQSKSSTKTPDPFRKKSPEYGYAMGGLSDVFNRAQTPFSLGPGWDDASIDKTLSGPTEQARSAAAEMMKLYQGGGSGPVSALFGQGLEGIGKTAAGDYLDVANTPAFKQLSDALRASGQYDFNDMVGGIKSDAARQGAFSSSARLAQEDAAAGRVATNTNNMLGQAGFQQYGAERGMQESAKQLAATLPPELLNGIMSMSQQEQSMLLNALNTKLQAKLAPETVAQGRYGQLLDFANLFKRGGSSTTTTPSLGSVIGGIFKAPSIGGSGS